MKPAPPSANTYKYFFSKTLQTLRNKKSGASPLTLIAHMKLALDGWIAKTWQLTECKVFVPVIEHTKTTEGDKDKERGQMHFHSYGSNTQTTVGPYGLRTLAHPAESEQISAADLDCVLLPLVAFDNFGTRLGMGGGYYDRFFANATNRPYLIGISFNVQQSSEPLEKSVWDVGLNAVVTESGITEFTNAL